MNIYPPSGRVASLLLLRLSVVSFFMLHTEGVRVEMLLQETSSDDKEWSSDTTVCM